MRLEDARNFLVSRSRAAAGVPDDDAASPHISVITIRPDEHMRKILHGLVPEDEMEAVLDGCVNAASNALVGLSMVNGEPESQVLTLAVMFAQQLTLGIKMGEG